MISSPGKDASSDTPALRFVCLSCKTSLVVVGGRKGVSGPCPKCDAWIDASQFEEGDETVRTLNAQLPPVSSGRRRRGQSITSGRGTVRADGFIDHEFNDRRELFVTLRILAVSLAVIAVILFVTLYLKQWATA
ncbi:hypothetical protein ACFSSA_03460 [Luteolibacter algae]|uniref:Uncharacterized protein n=1 Tax=Luteolibacter algae TaxID=454151 RepID=A0ABW5D5U6_9BACT